MGARSGALGSDGSVAHRLVDRNGCTSETTVVDPSWCDDAGASYEPCTCVEYQGCSDGYPVVECEYTAGHQFAPNAGAALWVFFSQL